MLSPKPLSARENEISFVTSSTTTCGPEVGDHGEESSLFGTGKDKVWKERWSRPREGWERQVK